MNAAEIFKFDLQGMIRIPAVLSPEEVAAANASIDAHREEFEIEPGHSEPFQHIEGLLGWPAGERDPFVHMLAHKTLVPYLNVICGQGFRMDHGPTILTMDRDQESNPDDTINSTVAVSVGLHGSSGPGFDPSQYYLWRDGKMHNSLVVVSFALCDQRPGDGGFVVVPGSHKSNLRGPDTLYMHKASDAAAFADSYIGFQEGLSKEVVCDAGDVVIFTEALTHGTMAWTAKTQRRVCHFRYNAGAQSRPLCALSRLAHLLSWAHCSGAANMAYSGGRHPYDNEHRAGNAWPEGWCDGLADDQSELFLLLALS